MAITSLIINPGSTSTKIGIYEDENLLFDETLRHSTEEIAQYASIIDQKDFRKNIIINFLKEKNFDMKKLGMVVGRGGLLRPIPGGTYKVTDLDPATTYLYDVKAVYGTKQSKWSNVIVVTTLSGSSVYGDVNCDGQVTMRADTKCTVTIRQHQIPLTLMHPHGYDYYSLLRKKLGWGKSLV